MRRMVAPKPRALVWPLLQSPSYDVSGRAARLSRLLVGAAAVMGRKAGVGVEVQRELEEGGVRLQATDRRVPDRETPPEPRRLAVLVADDEEMMRETIEAMLEFEGVEVISCSGGQEALDLFRQRREEIGLVLLDVLMPGLSGDETARALRRLDPERQDPPFLGLHRRRHRRPRGRSPDRGLPPEALSRPGARGEGATRLGGRRGLKAGDRAGNRTQQRRVQAPLNGFAARGERQLPQPVGGHLKIAERASSPSSRPA